MMIVSKDEVKKMSYYSRLQHYEQEKSELLSSMKSAPAKDYVEALEALRNKWNV